MDFLEGILLRPLWSDSDYQRRSHKGVYLGFSFLFWGLLLYVTYLLRATEQPRYFSYHLFSPVLFWILFFISPFVNALYYKQPVIIRFVILGMQLSKYIAAIMSCFICLKPLLTFKNPNFFKELMVYGDASFGSYISRFTESFGTTGLLFSIASIVILGFISLLFLVLVFVGVPPLFLFLVNFLQSVYDEFCIALFSLYKTFSKSNTSQTGASAFDKSKAMVRQYRDFSKRKKAQPKVQNHINNANKINKDIPSKKQHQQSNQIMKPSVNAKRK